jgi:hypothetical protein
VLNWESPGLIDIPTHRDQLGALGVVEGEVPFPFPVKRVYFLYDVPSDAVRGSHAHRDLHQLIVAVAGSFRVELDDATERRDFLLNKPSVGLVVPPGWWRTLHDFSSGSAALVFASEMYDEADYIRDYDQFVEWSRRG